MKALLLCIMTLTSTTVGFSQSVAINHADRKIPHGPAGTTVTKSISFSVLNCNPARITAVSYANNNSGTAAVSKYSTSAPAFPIAGNFSNGNLTLTIKHPDPVPKKDETIVLRFMLTLVDTVIFNTDTITLTTPPAVAKHPHWYEDKTNTLKYEFNQFTDFLGFDNQRPNGLLQQELIIKFPLVKKKTADTSAAKVFFQPFRSIVFNALFNRIDKSNSSQLYPAGTTLPNDPSNLNNIDSIRPYLTTLDIFKYSNLQIGLKFTALTFHIGNFRLSTVYEFNLLRNKPYYADTLISHNNVFTKDDVRSVYSFAHKIALFGNTSDLINKEIKVAVNAGMMLIRLKDSYYKQFDAGVVDPFDRSTTLLPASDAVIKRRAQPVWFFSGTLSKYWGEKNKNSVFFRTNYFYQTGKYRRYGGSGDLGSFDPKKFYTTKFHNHFLQLQLGIALDLNKFLGVKEEN